MFRLTVLLLMFVFGAMRLAEASVSQDKIDQLALGMQPAEVEAILGLPKTRLKRGLSTRWNYVYNANGDVFSVWFGSSGLQNAYGGDFETMHLVKPPDGFDQQTAYDPLKDVNRQVKAIETSSTNLSEEENIFKPLLPTRDALNALEQWRKVWEAKNVPVYVSKYVKDYSPRKGLSHKKWVKDLYRKFGKAKFIHITVDNTKTQLVDDFTVKITFNQAFKSNLFKDKVTKQFVMKYIGGTWLIESEQTLKKIY